ncbi:DUF1800 domain-containing protein [Thalassotalea sp. M1531]|uniref:DUF1800 domain-containing protein n=1 Tax=Thalassotalea algicola TaxID=2716224 RepID=A0A7Y0Q8A6_9GAMM|nr:DUF1800 domain-containing protein [Thalassotalea algicola]NMP32717.1 DUF1800 domain-containing protein [Thalassotalea algicola]
MASDTTLTPAERAHFLRRTCFSASDDLMLETEALTSKALLIDWLLAKPIGNYTYPDWYQSPPNLQDLSQDERKTVRRDMSKELLAWWQALLIQSDTPFYEQLSVFWHNHFVSSIQKVKLPNVMLKQNDLFRQQGLGNFKSLLASILKDPAMLIYLDNASSKKDSPNENLARELLELFTLGEGNYTEFDIKELARALTGASVKRRTGEYIFKKRWHDDGDKTIFGETASFSVENLAELIVKQPSCATFIVTKFWLHFVDSNPIESEVDIIAQTFVDSGFEIKALLEALFLSDFFWQSQGQQVKSPVQLIVGTYRQFNLASLTDRQWRSLTKNMGQLLFVPPNVKGWPGGKAWYASAAIFYRESFIDQFVRWHQSSGLQTSTTQLLAAQSVASLDEISNSSELMLAMADPAYQVI